MKLIIAAKDVKADIVDIHLQDKPQWYLDRINPQGKVPTVQHNGHLIRESLIGFGKMKISDNELYIMVPYRLC